MDASYYLIAIWHADNRRKNHSSQYNLFLCTYFFVADPHEKRKGVQGYEKKID